MALFLLDILKDGDAYPLKLIPLGTKVCFVEFRPGKGGQIARSAGAYCSLIRKTDTRAILQVGLLLDKMALVKRSSVQYVTGGV